MLLPHLKKKEIERRNWNSGGDNIGKISTRDIGGENEGSMAKTFVTSLTKCWKHANRSKEAEDRTERRQIGISIDIRHLEKSREHGAHGYV